MGDVQTQILTPPPPPSSWEVQLVQVGGGGHIWPKPGAQGAGFFFFWYIVGLKIYATLFVYAQKCSEFCGKCTCKMGENPPPPPQSGCWDWTPSG